MSSEPQHRTVPVIVGPTASGKTGAAIELARLLDGEIISADSRQVYKHLSIGTAKPSPAELAAIPHHFIDIAGPGEEFNAGMFGGMGRKVVDEVFARGRVPIVAGGSGLYVQSLVDGFFDGPGADPEYREQLAKRIRAHGIGDLIEELRRVDPESAEGIEPTRPHRVIRALEVFHLTGRPISMLHREAKIAVNFQPLMFGLWWERRALYQRINERCEWMLNNGLLDEVEDAVRRGYDPASNALNTVGYAEALALRSGEISREEMERLFKQNSRRYAKRQLTWFRRDTRIQWIPVDEGTTPDSVAAMIANAVHTA